MCSIIAYKGYRDAAPLIVRGLSMMEYRGYDSVGLATVHNSRLVVRKGVGNVGHVNARLNLDGMYGSVGIGHTRWATHGVVNDINAHPHVSCDGRVAVVHNGIVENHVELRSMLTTRGHIFRSETDSEVIAHLLEYLPTPVVYDGNSISKALLDLTSMLSGSYSFVALVHDGTLVGARNHEPLIIGLGNPRKGRDGMLFADECFIASDVLAFIGHTDKAVFLADGEAFIVREAQKGLSIEVYDRHGKVAKDVTQVAWEFADIDKGRFAHYTIKEIHEQRDTISRAFSIEGSRVHEVVRTLLASRRIVVTGSGSSYHAALMAKHLLSRICMVGCDVVVASEFLYSMDTHYVDDDSNCDHGVGPVLLAVSQSGETADVLDAVRMARSKGFRILSLVNSPLSTLARESDLFLSINAGPEIGVAATKSFTAQVALLYRICMEMAKAMGRSTMEIDIGNPSMHVGSILEGEEHIASTAERIKDASSVYIIAKGIHHVIALEGALKLKELAYVHAEAIHAGELKHGPLALIDGKSVVIALNPMDQTYRDMLTSVHEVKSRGAYIIGISDAESSLYDTILAIPGVEPLLYPLYEVIPLQLLAYHMALKRDCNPDYPRNLAKSVTVK
ncbi:MAG: glutamine--fructose-6-phosphate transaminase (isomerizing) [Candidatus Nitrosocaldus sp.]|nr:glutamine--fructose-6-phosphate transaminase (isomerizing) [Candidatus Nitrosocaldus sp.]MDW8275405.1 glutamine--fructose-6-phosphate transaminase (isomerizing) [Candidatus Nitrosocaldus sp.]